MKIRKRYCEYCEKVTKHVKTRDDSGVGRAILAFATLGSSELFNRVWYFCTKCKNKTTDWYD